MYGVSLPSRAQGLKSSCASNIQNKRLLCLQQPRVSFNEANGDMSKHPAAFILQGSFRAPPGRMTPLWAAVESLLPPSGQRRTWDVSQQSVLAVKLEL